VYRLVNGQTLVPQKIRNIFQCRALHEQPARKGMPQIVRPKVLNSGLKKRVIKPMSTIFKLVLPSWPTETHASSVALRAHDPEGGHSSII
jgi:hypothetical protein